MQDTMFAGFIFIRKFFLLDDQFSDLHLLHFPRSEVREEEETSKKKEDRDQDRLRPILRNEVRDTDASEDRAQCPV